VKHAAEKSSSQYPIRCFLAESIISQTAAYKYRGYFHTVEQRGMSLSVKPSIEVLVDMRFATFVLGDWFPSLYSSATLLYDSRGLAAGGK
jgi:hypothetical protein